jgi:hypothetical protein
MVCMMMSEEKKMNLHRLRKVSYFTSKLGDRDKLKLLKGIMYPDNADPLWFIGLPRGASKLGYALSNEGYRNFDEFISDQVDALYDHFEVDKIPKNVWIDVACGDILHIEDIKKEVMTAMNDSFWKRDLEIASIIKGRAISQLTKREIVEVYYRTEPAF